jgi:hypothetical protein
MIHKLCKWLKRTFAGGSLGLSSLADALEKDHQARKHNAVLQKAVLDHKMPTKPNDTRRNQGKHP